MTLDVDRSALRTGVVSLRDVRPKAWMTNLYAAENVAVAGGGEMMRVKPASGLPAKVARVDGRVGRLANRTGIASHELDRVAPVDHLLVFLNDSADLGVLAGIRHPLASLAPRRTLVQAECWPGDVRTSERLIRQVYEQFDDVFVTIEGSVEALSELHPRVHPLLQFTDVTEHPSALRFDRPIDVINYGRRDERQHELLRHWAEQNGSRWYVYDTLANGDTPDPFMHRRAMGALLSNSRVTVCDYARFSAVDRIGSAREAGSRFFEGLAGGCIVIGDLPTSALFTSACGGMDGVVQWSLGDERLPDAFHQLMADDDARHRISAEHRRLAVEHHDVAHRLREIHRTLGLPVPAAVTDRIERLASEG